MKKKNIVFIFILTLLTITFIGKVNAEDKDDVPVCSNSRLSELRKQASNLKVTYVPVKVEEQQKPDPENGITKVSENYVEVKLFNMTSQLRAHVIVNGGSGSYEKDVTYLDEKPDDDSITFRQLASNVNIEYTFEIYSDDFSECMNEKLRTLKITVPKFNFYSELDVCKEIPDYYLCAPYTTYNIDGSTFYDKVADYKEKLNNQEIVGEDDSNNGVVSQTISTLSKYKYVIVGVIVAVGVAITVIVIRRKKSAI